MSQPSRKVMFPVYQIDFSAVASGKRVAASKRRIRWRFGFPNHQALDAGRTGTDCRGEEHEVVIIWSVTSGKRQVLMDNKEIHYSCNRTGVIDHSWSSRGNHVMKVVCHAAPPMSANPGFRQYDLFIDGQSFFNMPKVYELGIRGPIPAHARVPGVGASSRGMVGGGDMGGGYGPPPSDPAGISAPRNQDEEEFALQQAIQASIEESKRHLETRQATTATGAASTTSGDEKSAASTSVQDNLDTDNNAASDLLDFAGDPAVALPAAPAAPPADTGAMLPYGGGGAAPPPQYGAAPPGYQQPPPQYQQQLHQAPPPPQSFYGAPTASSGSFDTRSTSYGAPAPAPGQALALPPSESFGGGGSSAGGYGGSVPPAAPTPTNYGSPPQQQYSSPESSLLFAPAPAPAADPLGLHAVDDPFAPKAPTHDDITSDILKAYGGAPPASTPTAAATAPGGYGAGGWDANVAPGGAGPGGPPPGQPAPIENGQPPSSGQPPQQNGGGPPVSLSMNGLVKTEEEPKNEFEKALRKLVNVDHIDQPAEELLKLTMKKEEDEKAKRNRNKSKGLPPVAHQMVGTGATLNQIKTVKPSGSPKEGIMNPSPQLFSPDAAMAGALVVHGQGPPPLQPQGFGVGYRNAPVNAAAGFGGTYGGGYGQPQMQPMPVQGAPPPQMMHQQPMYQQPMYQQPPPQYQQQGYQYR